MTHTRLSRIIRAPATDVFETVANAINYTKAVPEIVKVGFLGDQRSGVGTRFRETRPMGRREVTPPGSTWSWKRGHTGCSHASWSPS